ncbi:ethanolamine ammonia-lyase subunit EutC [Fundicoccus culcitae]|uniref:Ethanolamine ammonia-lyase small subunit n=1 Tax=Fundicoccus culcitae TaxID=2969821 RepID=A0ABY5P3R5_9LACT|nr:ethanolamine ammonia-lyase subunit EutC [Fundicoccus culcitae]UUX33327.1 ethanolamine ammonia-lyase subunit EutC [Fundicoccus culcitae]
MEQKELKELIRSILTDFVEDNEILVAKEPNHHSAEVKDEAPVDVNLIETPSKTPDNTEIEDKVLDDITEVNIREQFLVENAQDKDGYLRMKKNTPARLGLGRAGTRYKTEPVLRFRADHAAAQDAVFSYVDDELIKEMNFVPVETMCGDKDTYITRPDLGRKFSDEEMKKITDTIPKNADIAIVVGDGLSSAAIGANIRDIIPSIKQGLKTHNLDFGDIVFVKHCRVPAMDPIGEYTGAKVVCLLIGERPGLVTAESMSAYVAYKPTIGMPEARRTVISNIHGQGTPAVEAGAYIADLIKEMLDVKASGVDLKKVSKGG